MTKTLQTLENSEKSEQGGKRERIEEITAFEDFLCLFVVMIHAVSESISQYIKPGILSAVFYVFSRFLYFAVPAFLFASALKTVMKYKDGGFKYIRFLLDRLKRIYLPYVIWVVLYYLYFVFRLLYFPFNITDLLEYIFYGSIAAQFYFIVTLMQFYILMPLWRKMCEKIPFAVSFFTALVLTYIVRIYLTKVFADFAYFDRIFPYYLIFWVTGCYFGHNYQKCAETLEKYKSLIYSAAMLLSAHVFLQYLNFCGLIYYQYGEWVHIAFCMIFLLAFYLLVRGGMNLLTRMMNIFREFAKLSFYVYLTHVAALFETAYWLDNLGVTSVTVRFLFRALFAYLVPTAFSFAYVKIKSRFVKKIS
jgi:peptidoglycan/LPS O-acetylase OafA/YrhL